MATWALAALVVLATPALLPGGLLPPDPLVAGAWGPTLEGEVPAINMILLRDGRVLYWSGEDGRHNHLSQTNWVVAPPSKSLARVLDVRYGTVSTPSPEDGGQGDLFCSGQTALADGSILVAGGTRYATATQGGSPHLYGTDRARRFHPATLRFESIEDMHWARWYPTVLTLPGGDALALGGTTDFADPLGNIPFHERYDVQHDAWEELPDGATRLLPTYPRAHVIPSGPLEGRIAVLPAGCVLCHPVQDVRWNGLQVLDLNRGTWTDFPDASLQGVRDYGSTVMLALRPPDYHAEVLVAGGAVNLQPLPTPVSEVVDLGSAKPHSRPTGSLLHARWHPNLVLLPTGEVLAVGGMRVQSAFTGEGPAVLQAELFDPAAERWRLAASMEVHRGYHSTALLLPDGRVLTGGHVPFPHVQEVERQTFETRLEFYKPPYLFRGDRPRIAAAPEHVGYGETFHVATPDAPRVERAVLMRPGAVTHAYDNEQRAIELVLAPHGDGAVALRAPPRTEVAPPGWYMVFLLATSPYGPVPSDAWFLRLG